MQFPKFSLDEMEQMFKNMSKEDQDKMNSMAQDIFNEMTKSQFENIQEDVAEDPEEKSFYEKLNIKEEAYNDLPGIVLENLEAACDLEEFYEDYPDADLSASALFYIKALLNTLKETAYSSFKKADHSNRLPVKAALSLQDVIDFLSDVSKETLMENGYGNPDYFEWLSSLLVSLNNFLSLAEYGTIKKTELSLIKSLLLDNDALLTIGNAQIQKA